MLMNRPAKKASLTEPQPTSKPSEADQSVKVFLRMRPLKPMQHPEISPITLDVDSRAAAIVNPRNSSERLTYSFDRVFGDSHTQQDVFASVEPILKALFTGKNATVFAYGQTGSGKTHTMNGSSSSDPGIIPRAIELLLNHIQAEKLQATIQGSWLEIYNEKIFDLLSSERVPGGLDLREAPGRSIVVAGLTRMDIKSMPDFQSSHGLALKNRSTGATKLNEHSSRSHFVLQLHISTQQSPEVLLSSKLHLIDLAGSEDNRRTGNSGARLVESGAINRSLFVLGQVVEALNKSASRVPYRDSKITRFLQDSLGGTALGLMIACISPEPFDFVDSYNTLNFATKSSFIKNNIVINETVVQTVSVASREAQLAEYRSKKKRGIEGKGRLNEPAKRARYSNNSGNSSLSENSSFEMSPGKFKDIITGVEGAVTHAIPKYIAGGTSKAEFIVSQMLEHEEFKQTLLKEVENHIQQKRETSSTAEGSRLLFKGADAGASLKVKPFKGKLTDEGVLKATQGSSKHGDGCSEDKPSLLLMQPARKLAKAKSVAKAAVRPIDDIENDLMQDSGDDYIPPSDSDDAAPTPHRPKKKPSTKVGRLKKEAKTLLLVDLVTPPPAASKRPAHAPLDLSASSESEAALRLRLLTAELDDLGPGSGPKSESLAGVIKLKQMGVDLMQSGKLDEALKAFQKALEHGLSLKSSPPVDLCQRISKTIRELESQTGLAEDDPPPPKRKSKPKKKRKDLVQLSSATDAPAATTEAVEQDSAHEDSGAVPRPPKRGPSKTSSVSELDFELLKNADAETRILLICNQASLGQMTRRGDAKLELVGKAKAQKIIEAREKRGAFEKLSDLVDAEVFSETQLRVFIGANTAKETQ